MKKILSVLMILTLTIQLGGGLTLFAEVNNQNRIKNYKQFGPSEIIITEEEAINFDMDAFLLEKKIGAIGVDTIAPNLKDVAYIDSSMIINEESSDEAYVVENHKPNPIAGTWTNYVYRETTTTYAAQFRIYVVDYADTTTYPDRYVDKLDVEKQELTILQGSTYDAVADHGVTLSEFDPNTQLVSDIPLDNSNPNHELVESNVDTDVIGDYQTKIWINRYHSDLQRMTFEGVVLDVHVVDDSNSPILINADDKEVKKSDAPLDESGIKELMNVQAINTDTDTMIDVDTIEVLNEDGTYNYGTPDVGVYTFRFTAQDGEYAKVTNATLTVKANLEDINNTEIIGNNPLIYTSAEAPADIDGVIEDAQLKVVDYTNDEIVGSADLTVSNVVENTYVNEIGLYGIPVQAQSPTSTKVEDAILFVEITDGVPTLDSAQITSEEVVAIGKGESFDPFNPDMNVVASYTEAQATVDITDPSTSEYITISSDVNPDEEGTYHVIYTLNAPTGAKAVSTTTVIVKNKSLKEDVTITGNDMIVLAANAPTTDDEMITLLGVKAYDPLIEAFLDNSEISVQTDFPYDGSYDLDQVYDVTFSAIGQSYIKDDITLKLTVTSDATKIHTYSFEKNPIIKIQVGEDKDIQEAIDLAEVKLLEYDSTGAQVNAYDLNTLLSVYNITPEQYTIEAQKEGTIQMVFGQNTIDGLKQTMVQVVFEDSIPGYVQITANDIVLEQGSYYDPILSHQNRSIQYIDENGAIQDMEFSSDNTNLVVEEDVNFDSNAADGTEFETKYTVTSPIASNPLEYTHTAKVTITTNSQDLFWTTNIVNLSNQQAVSDEIIIRSMIDPNGGVDPDRVGIVNYGGFDLENPVVGEYTITLSYDEESTGITHTETGILNVI